MKRNTPEHWKMDDLASRLGVCLAQAVGHMEMLFHLTAKQSPHGNIGKMPNASIAKKCGWNGDPDEFIKALMESKWLDVCMRNRLIVHDWHEHCDDATKKAVARSNIPFCKPENTVPDNGGQSLPTSDTQPDNGVLPSLAMPSLAMPSLAMPYANETRQPPEIHFTPPAVVDPLPQYADEVKAEAKQLHLDYHFWRYGSLPSYQSDTVVASLQAIAATVEAFGAEAGQKLRQFIKQPPAGFPRNSPLWKIFVHLGLEATHDRPRNNNGTQRRTATGGDAWGDAERYDGRNVPYLDHATGEIVTPAAAG